MKNKKVYYVKESKNKDNFKTFRNLAGILHLNLSRRKDEIQ